MSKKKKSRQPQVSSQKAPSLTPDKGKWKMILLFIGVALVLYGNTLGHDYALDDDVVFLKNQFVQNGFSGFGDILSNGFITGFNGTNDQSYRPLVLMAFATEHAIFGNSPAIGHFINLLLYACCGLLVFKLMRLFFKEANIWIPVLIALVFMAHPVHTEAVANIKGRDDILHFLFAIGSVYYLMKYVNGGNKKQLIWSGLCYFAALLCKEMAVTFVAIIPLTLWFFTDWKWKRILTQTALYTGILGTYMLIRLSVLDGLTFDEDMRIVNNSLAAAGTEAERLSTSLMIMGLYVKLLFVPHPLSWDYSFNQISIVGLASWQTLISIALFAGLGIVAIRGFIKKDALAWGILFFLITMSIVSNVFIMLGATMGERFLFTPSLGFAMVLVLLVARINKSELTSLVLAKKKPFIVPIVIVLLLFTVKTMQRNTVWKDNQSLYESGVISAPNSTRTWSALGTSYRIQAETSQYASEKQSLFNEALRSYQKSVAILDDNFESWYNMGVVYNQLGSPENALLTFRKTVSISPTYANAWNNIGVHYFNKNEYDSAQANFQRAYDINPNDGNTVANMGLIYHNRGDLPSAISWYLRGLQLEPNNRNTAKNLALAYRQNGEPAKAVPYENLARRPQ
ncbi:MAG: tetratricopeptide repeat protein [Roseivirga sp.]|nr:tetratricopeptide repeat protein [Roseivirga sp.]